MSDWSNLDDIMQDLSLAQGDFVPVELETFAAVGPPAYKIVEEGYPQNEELLSFASGGDGCEKFPAPDCELIKIMLNRVKEIEQEDDDGAHSSDHNPHSPEVVPEKAQKKLKRNVALSSIITAKEAEVSARGPMPKEMIPLMFKKKSVNPTKDSQGSENIASVQKLSPPHEESKEYKPSANALKYFSKYLKKSQLKAQLEDDIWAKAERQMKELENRKKRKSEHMIRQERGNVASPDDVYEFASIFELGLAEHRHLMDEDCMVCIVAAKHGYYI